MLKLRFGVVLVMCLAALAFVGCLDGDDDNDIAPAANATTGALNITSTAQLPAGSAFGSLRAAVTTNYVAQIFLNGQIATTVTRLDVPATDTTKLVLSTTLTTNAGTFQISVAIFPANNTGTPLFKAYYSNVALTAGQTVATTTIITTTDTARALVYDSWRLQAANANANKFSDFLAKGPDVSTLAAAITTKLTGTLNASTTISYADLTTEIETIVASTTTGATPPVQLVAAPTFNPAAGSFDATQTVALTTTTTGATIFYTTDGTTPASNSATYSAPLAIGQDTVLKAYASKSGMTDSAVTVGTYTFMTAAPVIAPASGTFDATQTITLTSTTTGAQIYYTLDGSTPTATSTLYAGAFTLSANATVKAIAMAPGLPASTVTSGVFAFMVADPTFTPAAGNLTSAQNVAITTTTTGAAIYYTTDGSNPTAASTLYAGPINVATDTTIKAIAILAGIANSNVVTAAYTVGAIPTTVADPVFTPAAGPTATGTQVTITTTTSGATIYYTTDGTTPSNSSTVYAGPITINASMTIRAFATKTGLTNSNFVQGNFVVPPSTIRFTQTGGMAAVTYSHDAHAQRASCTQCHTTYQFPYSQANLTNPANMTLLETTLCGRCHDGTTAFTAGGNCGTCHQ